MHWNLVFLCLFSVTNLGAYSAFAENSVGTSPSVTVSVAEEPLLAKINSPDPIEAAKALIAVIPDSGSLIKHYTSLIDIVRSAQGELDLAILYDACTGCHRWHSDVIADKRKDLAILEWMSQKIWEMPGIPEKKRLLDQYIGDVGHLMDEGKIKPLMGLKLTTYTMATHFVGSDVHTDALLNLFKRYMKTGDQEVDTHIRFAFMLQTDAFLSESIDAKALVDILRVNYPATPFPDDIVRFYYPLGARRDHPIKREIYNDIMSLSTSDLHNKITSNSGSTNINYTCGIALARVFDQYDKDPMEVKATIKELLDKELLIYPIAACLTSVPFYGPGNSKAHPLMLREDVIKMILDKFEIKMKQIHCSLDEHVIFGALHSCLKEFPKRNKNGEFPEGENLQRQCIRILMDGAIAWERKYDETSHSISNTPRNFLVDNVDVYSPATKQYIRELALKKSKNQNKYWWFIDTKQDKIQKVLDDIAAIK